MEHIGLYNGNYIPSLESIDKVGFFHLYLSVLCDNVSNDKLKIM